MPALPQSLPMQAPRGVVGGVQPLDFSALEEGLQQAARQIERVDDERRKADELVAQREMETHQQTYVIGAAERANLYDGRNPGYAENELAQFDAAFQPLLDREDLSDGVKMAIGQRVRSYRAETGMRAMGLEGELRGRRSAADRDAADQASAVQLMMGVLSDFDDAEDELRKNWDGVSPGYAEGVMTAFRERAQTALDAATPAQRDRLQPMLMSQQVSLQARVLAAEDDRRDAATLTVVKDGLTQFINRVTRDPSLLERADTELAPILEAAPAFMRAALLKETKAEARYQSADARISAGQYEEVNKEIEAGSYDDLDPAKLQRLKDTVVSARANGVVVSEQEKADLEAAIQADLRNILKGDPADTSLLARARAAGGEPLETQVRINQQAAQNVRPLMSRLRTMTPVQAQQELERLQGEAGDAIGARTLELASEMVRQDAANRADPATWAATPVGPGDQVADNVLSRFRAFQSAPSEETAVAYARSTWQAQMSAGIPEGSRRVLDRATAEAWVSELDATGAGQAQLQSLNQKIGLFGPYRRQVIQELRVAGLDDADLGAMAHYASSPRRLSLYARDRATKLTDLVEKREDRTQIDDAIRTALSAYNRAFNTRDNARTSFGAAQRTAYSLVKNGSSVEDAVKAATDPMTENWDFMGTWALPKNQGLNSARVARSMATDVRDLVRRNGEEGFTPPSDRYTPEQSRRVYADLVEERAYWRNLQDGSGVELVMPAGDGVIRRVKNKTGEDVVRTWEQLHEASRDAPRSAPAVSGRIWG